jgi:hypothetical protein
LNLERKSYSGTQRLILKQPAAGSQRDRYEAVFAKPGSIYTSKKASHLATDLFNHSAPKTPVLQAQGRLSCLSLVTLCASWNFPPTATRFGQPKSVFRWPAGSRISRPSPHISVSNDRREKLEWFEISHVLGERRPWVLMGVGVV